MDELKEKIDEMTADFKKITDNLAEMRELVKEVQKRELNTDYSHVFKPLAHAAADYPPPFSVIKYGNTTITLCDQAQWTSTRFEHTDAHTREKSMRYRTDIESDPGKRSEYKTLHKVTLGSGECYGVHMVELQTETPVIEESFAIIDKHGNRGCCDLYPLEAVSLPPILMFWCGLYLVTEREMTFYYQ